MVRHYRKVIHISAEDSPNVRLAKAQIAMGLEPTGETVLAGVLSWDEYKKRRATWDKIKQCISLDGQFYEGPEELLFPPAWLNLAEEYHRQVHGRHRPALALGIDPAQGGDDTSFCVVAADGILYQQSLKTPDTTYIVSRTIALMNEYNLPEENVVIDKGGGGFEHFCTLQRMGYNVRTVGFGESVTPEMTAYTKLWDEKVDIFHQRHVYKNRRAQLYHSARLMIQPVKDADGNEHSKFGIPAELTELRRQLAPIPLRYDQEGRIYIPPKNKKPGSKETQENLFDLIGRSPDDADAFVLAIYGLQEENEGQTASGGWFG